MARRFQRPPERNPSQQQAQDETELQLNHERGHAGNQDVGGDVGFKVTRVGRDWY
jgi:hypothetical protein